MTTRPMKHHHLALMVIGAVILVAVSTFFIGCAEVLAGQAAPTIAPPPADLGQLIPNAAIALTSVLGVGLTGFVVKGTSAADSWWQQHVVPKTKWSQPVLALGASIGLGILGQKLGIPGLQDMNQVLLQSPATTLAVIALREGTSAIAKAVPRF